MLLTKCCCCFNLKNGFFSYGILSMASRLIICLNLYNAKVYDRPHHNSEYATIQIIITQVMLTYSGWFITSVFCLFFTLKGIVQKRSILIYPYITVLVVELIGTLIASILAAIFITPIYLIVLLIAIPIMLYELWCLISLYKRMRNNENMRCTVDDIITPLNTVC